MIRKLYISFSFKFNGIPLDKLRCLENYDIDIRSDRRERNDYENEQDFLHSLETYSNNTKNEIYHSDALLVYFDRMTILKLIILFFQKFPIQRFVAFLLF